MIKFDVVQLLQDAADSSRQGELQIKANGVTWTLYLTGSQLHYAEHSLQTLDTLDQVIQQLGFDAALPLRQKLGHEENLSLQRAIVHLQALQLINSVQAAQLFAAITEEAIELLLWLPEGEQEWQHKAIPEPVQGLGTPLYVVLERLTKRCESWKALNPVIASPHQCPRCDNLVQLYQAVSYGMLPGSTLEMMARLMQGISIRQLAFLLKQDVLKLSQLLYPYINRGVIRLEPPQAPFNMLPTIPIGSMVAGAIPNWQTRNPESPRRENPSRETATGQHTYSRDTSSHDAYNRDTLTGIVYSRDTAAVRLDVAASSPSTTNTTIVKTYKIVCIDDSPTVLETIQRYLGRDRFEVATVENPMASLSALFDMKPDLILMDVSMPGIDGNRLCQILKRSSVFTHVPIIMVSGNTGLIDREKAKAAGATDYLTKPFSKEELLALVTQYLQPAVVA
jgi:two-component system, chemotaxis family, response regulator PixG